MQIERICQITKATGSENFLQCIIKRLESKRFITETTVSCIKIKKDQMLSHIKIIKIRSDLKIIINVVSKYYKWPLAINRIT